MKANKNPKFEILERDKEYYHILVNRRLHVPKIGDYIDNFDVIIYDAKGYESFKKHKRVLGLKSDEVIHIPQSLFEKEQKEEEIEEEPQEEEKIKPIVKRKTTRK